MKLSLASLAVAVAGGLLQPVVGTVLVPKFSSCINSYSDVAQPDRQMVVNDVFASLLNGKEALAQNLNGDGVDVLRLDLFGTINQTLNEFNVTTEKWYTLFTSAAEADVKQWEFRSRLCNSLYPMGNQTYTPGWNYCPIPPGAFGLNVSIPLYNIHELATLATQVRVVDSAEPARTVACVNIFVTPYAADSWPYKVFLWFPAAIAMAYFVTTWAARFAAGWVVGANRTSMGRREVTMLKWGTMVISGLSGERFSVSSALLRFVTPGLRDIMFHIQFVTMLGMININWPSFFYPIVAQSAWADSLWNVSIVSNEHTSLYPTNFTTPLKYAPFMDQPTHPLYLNVTGKNRLLDLTNEPDGMRSFAHAVGLRSRDLFGTCMAIFLMLAGGIIVIHLVLWGIHCLTELLSPESDPRRRRQPVRHNASRSSLGDLAGAGYGTHSRSSSNGKEWFDQRHSSSADLNPLPSTPRAAQRLTAPSKWHRIRKRFAFRGEAGAFHFSALYGNLLRLIITFHFPITAFSVFQLTLFESSIVARVFAALALAFIAVLIPGFIMYKIYRTPTGKLYDAARTLLSLGTVYNVYEPEKQLYRTLPLSASLIQGIVIGAGQKSGLAQTIVLVIVELFTFVATTVWSPWGEGAGMGAQVVFLSILRIGSIIMTMVMCREIALDEGAQQWLTYAVLIVQAVIFVFFFFMIVTKIIEGLIRLFGGAPFDESTHPIDAGIFAAIMDLDCFNGVRGGKAAERRRRKRDSRALQRNVSVAGSLTTQMMLDRHSQGVERQGYPLLESRRDYNPVRTTSIDQLTYGHRANSSDQESLSERLTDDSHGRILDAWQPAIYGSPQHPVSPGERSSKRQSWGGTTPNIRVTSEPYHSRAQSSSTMEGLMSSHGRGPGVNPNAYGPPPISYPPTAENRGRTLRPPLSVTRQRSLNNLDPEEDGQQRRSGGRWFQRVPLNDESDSDDDHITTETGYGNDTSSSGHHSSGGWRGMFSRRRKIMDERAKSEKMARKGAAINESGAAFLGIAPPSSRFRVHRKNRTSSGDALAAVQGNSNSATPLLDRPPPSSFKVHRAGAPPRSSSVSPPPTGPPSPQVQVPLVAENPAAPPPSSFRVHRNRPSPTPSTSTSASATAPGQATAPGPFSAVSPQEALTPKVDFSGYAAGLFRPLDVNSDSQQGSTADERGGYGHAF